MALRYLLKLLLNYVPRVYSGRHGQDSWAEMGRDGQDAQDYFLYRSLAIITCFLLQVFHYRQHFSYPWIGARCEWCSPFWRDAIEGMPMRLQELDDVPRNRKWWEDAMPSVGASFPPRGLIGAGTRPEKK